MAETLCHLVRLIRRIDTVTKDTKRVPVVEAVLDPLSRADQPGGLARGRSQRRVLLETLYNIAEERGAISSEAVQRDGKDITMCWLVDDHPLVQYARQAAAGIVHLFNFVGTTKGHGEQVDWVNQALFAELLSRVEGDALESSLKTAVERGLMRPEAHGSKPGYVVDRTQAEVRMLLGEFHRLDGGSTGSDAEATDAEATGAEAPVVEDDVIDEAPAEAGEERPSTPAPRKRTRRGSRGGRNRRGGRGRKKTTSTTSEAAD